MSLERFSRQSPGVVQAVMSIGVLLAAMWAIEIVDTVALSDRLQRNGIFPRRLDGLDGILWSPLLHDGWGHIIANTIPFIILGALISLRGLRSWLASTFFIVVVGGALTWLFARSGNHIGASGLIFGYFGYLVTAALKERRPLSILSAVIALVLYSGFVWGVVPTDGVSWEGHLFGALSGGAAAWTGIGRRATAPSSSADPLSAQGAARLT